MTVKTIYKLLFKNLQHFYFKLTHQVDRIVPYKVLIEVSNHCNSRCLHCDIWKVEKENITTINLEELRPFLKEMNRNLLWLALTGGEITIYKQFDLLIDLLRECSPSLRIMTFTTNGLLPNRTLSYALMIKNELKCDVFITISLDGDAEAHDRIRGVNGNYQRAQDTYKLLKENNIPCHFGITVSHSNYLFIRNSFRDFRNSIKAITFLHTSGIFLTRNEPVEKEKDEKISEALAVIYKNYKVSSLGEMLVKMSVKIAILFLKKERKTNVIPCDVGLSSIHLLSNGNILPCMYLPPIDKLGPSFNLKAFHNEKAKEIRENIKNDHCPHCWMNCYGIHNILQSPIKTLAVIMKPT